MLATSPRAMARAGARRVIHDYGRLHLDSGESIPWFGGGASGIGKWIYRQNQIRNSQRRICEQMQVLVDSGTLTPGDVDHLLGWIKRMKECGLLVVSTKCDQGHFGSHTECCNCPPCPRFERMRAAHYVARAEKFTKTMKIPASMITVTLRHHEGENLALSVQRVIETRRALARFLQRNYGMVAGFGAIELSQDEHVHFHFLGWLKYVPRPVLQRWLRSRDCTVPHCPHPADDRCEICRGETGENPRECDHLDGDRRRCNGSFMLDIRQARSAVEALKYATKPLPVAGDPNAVTTPEEAAYLQEQILFRLALYGRHRVESYGLARKKIEGEEGDDEVTDSAVCACGSPRHKIATHVALPRMRGYRTELLPKETSPPRRAPPGFQPLRKRLCVN